MTQTRVVTGVSVRLNGVTVPGLNHIGLPGIVRNIIQDDRHVLSHQTPQLGLVRYQPMVILLYDVPSMRQFYAALAAMTLDDYQVLLSDGTLLTFQGLVTDAVPAGAPIDAIQALAVTIQPQGVLDWAGTLFGVSVVTDRWLLTDSSSALLTDSGVGIEVD